MWASLYLSQPPPLHPLIPKPRLTPLPLTVVSANSRPQPDRDFGVLGRSILTKLKSNPNPKPTNINVPKQKKQKQEERLESSRHISGSEVLFAMQRAAAKKRKETQKKKTKIVGEGLSSASRNREEEEDGVDYSKVRPLCLKSDWGRRLDELEMRLHVLSSKNI
ncbi:hypothetical protein ACLB2K_076503 [Fragaria x ananassa]